MISTVCICGAGTMGSGIAQVSARSGFATILFDIDAAMIEKAKAAIEKNLLDLAAKKKPGEQEVTDTLTRILFTTAPSECKADVIIEAIVENTEAKAELFNRLIAVNDEACIFASNTSSLSITAIAGKTMRPGKVIGMHFFNPPPLMKLVEIVQADQTEQHTTDQIIQLAKQMGKTPVLCKDAPGFIVNHVARPYYLEALRLLEQGIGDVETIDKIMEASGFRLGPFRLMDLIGNDINYTVSCSVYEAMNKPERLRPSPIQEQKVKNREWGRKTGKGYYIYT